MAVIEGYSIDIDSMKSSTCGTIGFAQKGGKKYFCKRFNEHVEPADNGALSPKMIAKNKAEFDAWKKRKVRVNSTLRTVAGRGGNIVFPLAEAVYEHKWTEFSEFIEGAVPDEDIPKVISKLSDDEKILVLKIAMGALQTIHGQKMVHGDLKLPNIMLVKNDAGHYVSKIIDFDGAFFEDDVPLDSITGTVDYFSPELAWYQCTEDEDDRAVIAKNITTKSDIFTMGLILHEYLTGKKPEADHLTTSLKRRADRGEFIYPWQVLFANDRGEEKSQLAVSSKIKNPAIVVLISDMINMEPESRPSASEVLLRLTNMELPFDTEGWPEDSITINVENAKKSVCALRKMTYSTKVDGKVQDVHTYEVVEKDGRRFKKTKEELIAAGYALPAESWGEPVPAHGIEWNMPVLQAQFVSIESFDANRYKLISRSGRTMLLTVQQLVMLHYANRIGGGAVTGTTGGTSTGTTGGTSTGTTGGTSTGTTGGTSTGTTGGTSTGTTGGTSTGTTPGPASLWPEDEALYKINTEYLSGQGIEFVGQATVGGKKAYTFKIKGVEKTMPLMNCTMLKFIVKK